MDARHELVRYDRMRHFTVRISRIEYMMSHMHGSFELSYVLKGSGQCTIGDKAVTMEPGQLILINPYEVHSFVSNNEEPLIILSAHFHRFFLRRYVERIPKLRFSGSSIETLSYNQYKELVFLLTKTAAVYFTESESQQFDVLACAILLMGKLVSYLEWELDETSDAADREVKKNRSQRLMEYIDENYRQKITLAQLAEMEGVSTTHMSHFFRKSFGMTFQSYLTTQRFEKALVLIRDPSVPLADVYMQCGFSDQRYLEAACQKTFGCSVSEYRNWCEEHGDGVIVQTQTDMYTRYSREESLALLEQYLGPEQFRELI